MAYVHQQTAQDTIVVEETHQKPTACPSCHNTTDFTFIGTQIWPPRVAERLKIPQQTTLWRCENCHTTITKT